MTQRLEQLGLPGGVVVGGGGLIVQLGEEGGQIVGHIAQSVCRGSAGSAPLLLATVVA